MSTLDGFLYNLLAIGVVFPWVYAYGPGRLHQVDWTMAVLVALGAQAAVATVYSLLSAILPVSGGDYVYQTRAFGPKGFIPVMSGFVLWFLVWIPFSGWLFVKFGVVPLACSLGGASTPWLAWLQWRGGVLAATVLLSLVAVAVLMRGLRFFALLQKGIFVLTLGAAAATLWVLHAHQGTFVGDINAYASSLSNSSRRQGAGSPMR